MTIQSFLFPVVCLALEWTGTRRLGWITLCQVTSSTEQVSVLVAEISAFFSRTKCVKIRMCERVKMSMCERDPLCCSRSTWSTSSKAKDTTCVKYEFRLYGFWNRCFHSARWEWKCDGVGSVRLPRISRPNSEGRRRQSHSTAQPTGWSGPLWYTCIDINAHIMFTLSVGAAHVPLGLNGLERICNDARLSLSWL